MRRELETLLEIHQLGYLEDRLEYTIDLWESSYAGLDAQFLMNATKVLAQYTDSTIGKALRKMLKLSDSELKLYAELLRT